MTTTQNLSNRLRKMARIVAGRDDSGDLATAYQMQVFVISLLTMLVACLFYAPAYWFLGDPVGAIAIALGLLPGGVAIAVYFLAGNLILGLQILSGTIFLLTSYLTYHQGGLTAPVAPWMILVPFALLTAGLPRPAIIWAAIVLSEMVFMGCLTALGYEFPRERGHNPEAIYAISQPGLCVIVCLFLAMVDRTRRLAQKQLQETNVELGAARDTALAAVRAKSEFLANMSHEIRTPLNGVLGAGEILATTPLSADQRRLVETLKHSGEGLLTLINDILDFSKIEAGRLTLESVPFSPHDIIATVADLFAPRCAEKGLEISWQIAADMPHRVIGDPTRVRQVLSNLLGNAVKFTDAGEIEIIVSSAMMETPANVVLHFGVRDTGVGIDSETLSRLFQPFTQADGSTTRVYGGTGLGLAISSDLARAMGGRIDVTSVPGRGSTFTLVMPTTALAETSQEDRAMPLAGNSVLVIESHEGTRRMLADAVISLGGSVTSMDDPAELREAGGRDTSYSLALVAERFVHATEGTPDAGTLRQLARRTPLVMTGMVGARLPETPDLPIRGVLQKPVTRASLAAVVQKPDSAPAAPSIEASQIGAHVLLAEDNVVNQKIALAMLTRLGCTVEVATQGAAAVIAWQTGSHDIVLMDCQMPVMDGYEATRQIRGLEASLDRPRTPIVALTANALTGDRELCIAAGMDDHLGKPFTLSGLRAVIERWCTPKPVQRSA